MSLITSIRQDQLNGYAFIMKPGDQSRRMIDLPAGRTPDCDIDLCVVTVDLYRTVQDVRDSTRGSSDRDNVPAGSVDHAVALIEWGAGRGLNKARVDFIHGQRISIAASSLRVTAEYDGTCGPPVNLSACVMFGTIGANKAQYTDIPKEGPMLIPASVETRFRYIPDFARELVLVDNGSTSDYKVTFSSEPRHNATEAVMTRVIASTGTPTTLPIPNGVDYYAITNDDTMNGHIVYPIFHLFL